MNELNPRVSIDYSPNATIVTLMDEKILEQEVIQSLEDSIMPLVSFASGINLLIDFSQVEFLSSSVLGLLIRISKRVYEFDGSMRLCGINPKIAQIFKITRLDEVFAIFDDCESAVQSFG